MADAELKAVSNPLATDREKRLAQAKERAKLLNAQKRAAKHETTVLEEKKPELPTVTEPIAALITEIASDAEVAEVAPEQAAPAEKIGEVVVSQPVETKSPEQAILDSVLYEDDSEARVIAWGDNQKCGVFSSKNDVLILFRHQLGIGIGLPCSRVVHIPALMEMAVKQLVCGDDFALALSDKGLAFSWGGNSCGQLGLGHTNEQLRPVAISALLLHTIRHVCAGPDFAFAITACTYSRQHDTGDLYGWGQNDCSQLGLGHSQTDVYKPTRVAPNARLVCAGRKHAAAIDTLGHILTWGANDKGQTGHSSNKIQSRPAIVDAISTLQFISLSCGDYHTAAVSREQTVITWGCDEQGQTGQQSYFSSSPVVKPAIVYVFGSNSNGELGQDRKDTIVRSPLLLTLNEPVSNIATGDSRTALIRKDGRIFILGDASYFNQQASKMAFAHLAMGKSFTIASRKIS